MVKVLNNIEEARQYNEELCKAHEITAELYHKAMDKGMKIYTSVGCLREEREYLPDIPHWLHS